MAILVLRRTAIFIAFVLIWALVAAAMAHAATRDREVVAFSGFAPGTIVVKTAERSLYYVLDEQRALRFAVGVGRNGKTWTGVARVEGKYVRPAWAPPEEIRREHPSLPEVIPGGAANNPMGEAALTMRGGEYAFTAPTGRNRSAASSPTAVFACTTTTSSSFIAWSRSARP